MAPPHLLFPLQPFKAAEGRAEILRGVGVVWSRALMKFKK